MSAAQSSSVGVDDVICRPPRPVAVGRVAARSAIAVLVAASVGGYAGARLARRIDARRLRLGMTLLTTAMTTAFFVRAAS
jgi:uncharacterized membrane protein YfcA